MRTKLLRVVFLCLAFCLPAAGQKQNLPVQININLSEVKGPMNHIWAWFGYDEPNYTYMKDGRKLLGEISDFSPVPVYVRAHNLMTSGDGTPSFKWGSTDMYKEDNNGNPVYNWKIVDSIFDTYINLGMKPLAEIGFMPEALTSGPQPYRHYWKPGMDYRAIYTGWAYPPVNYDKWSELIFQWVKHCVERYGQKEVETWYWELWNEPDIDYLKAENKVETYCKMYDYASSAVKRALPSARVGGPHTTGGGARFLDAFLKHCISGINYSTGKVGAPLDFVAFHAKGSPQLVDGVVRMGMRNQLKNISDNLKVVASYPETKNLPVIIGESDPEGCAACGMYTNPENAYRNGTLYSSYTAASVSRIFDINEKMGTNLIGAVNWSFEFEDQPWFHGFRDLATNGVDKPVLNVFRMFSMMKGERVQVSGDLQYTSDSIIAGSVRGERTDINAFAVKGDKEVTVMIWNYHDVDLQDEGQDVTLTLKNIGFNKATLTHYRIDSNHSNSYEAWKRMGSPQAPSPEQVKELEQAGKLQMLSKPVRVKAKNNELQLSMKLPRQAVSLIRLTY